jgi:hypothetical protein
LHLRTKNEKDEINEGKIAQKIKEYFDSNYEPNWHCVVGIIY